MEIFHLEIPSIERKAEALEYLEEHVRFASNLNGTGGLDKCLKGLTYEEWLDNVIKCQEKDYAESKGKVAATTYFTIRESDNKIIGMVSFRHYLNEYLKKFGGHIGYGIRPTERRKGYAKIQLYLVLLEAQKMGIDKVMVDCVDTNEASEKVIKSLGGVFEREVYEENKKVTLHNYWINVDESISKNEEKYQPFVCNSSKKV